MNIKNTPLFEEQNGVVCHSLCSAENCSKYCTEENDRWLNGRLKDL